jgi:hypothetical protein
MREQRLDRLLHVGGRGRRPEAAAEAMEVRVGLEREVVGRDVRGAAPHRLVHVGERAFERLPGSAYMMSAFTVGKIASAASSARRASSAPCTRPMAASRASSKLCTPSESRFTPAAR